MTTTIPVLVLLKTDERTCVGKGDAFVIDNDVHGQCDLRVSKTSSGEDRRGRRKRGVVRGGRLEVVDGVGEVSVVCNGDGLGVVVYIRDVEGSSLQPKRFLDLCPVR